VNAEITLYRGDIPTGLTLAATVAVDTESMGLNPMRDRLCLVQLSTGDGKTHLVQFEPGDYAAPNLGKMLVDPAITKLFHFARADLGMLAHYLGVMPKPIYCTRIASVLARTYTDKHGLKDLAHDLLGIELAKEQQTSDWGAPQLTQAQLNYAAGDVLYLHRIKDKLDNILVREHRAQLAQAVFDCLPARVELDLAGWENVDIFSHKIM
jgi:ribonuclease D